MAAATQRPRTPPRERDRSRPRRPQPDRGPLAGRPRRPPRRCWREVSPAALGGEAPAHLVGVTGPPGAGKSTLLCALVAEWRDAGRTVAVLAVDPSSKRSGGSLLGDRARIDHDPKDDGILIRSTAAGGRLGGLAAATREAAQALAAAFDVVVVETVGVGQSETDVEEVCDTVAVVVQPGSGDALQFLKAGIMEVPDVLVVTKADLGDVASAPARDLDQALRGARLARRPGGRGLVRASPIGNRRAGRRARRPPRGHRPGRPAPARASPLGPARSSPPSTARARASLGGRREAQRLLQDRGSNESVADLVGALTEAAA